MGGFRMCGRLARRRQRHAVVNEDDRQCGLRTCQREAQSITSDKQRARR